MSVIPDPATTDWVPLQGRPSGMAYFGQHQVGHTYQDGDCVIGSDGVLYACVTDGTTTAPVAWPGAAAPQGPPGPQGAAGVGIPMPVVDGQWIKGVAGAAVWSPLAAADVRGAGDAGWAAMNPLTDSWVNYGGGTSPFGACKYRKLASGLVVLSGLLARGAAPAANSLIFTFPVGYRPGAQLIFNCQCNTATCRMDLRPDGALLFVSVNGTGEVQSYLALENICWYAEA